MVLQSRSISAVLPEPTGPPMPTRSGPWGLDMSGDLSLVVILAKAGTQYPAALRFHRWRLGILGHPVKPVDDRRECGTAVHHDLNSLVYCVSCRMLARSARKVALPRSSSDVPSARFPTATTSGSSAASAR